MRLGSLQWRHNDHDSVSNHQPHGCLLNHLFRRRSKKTSKLRVTGLCVGNSPGPVDSPHKGPVMRKMFPFDDVIMSYLGTNMNMDGMVRCEIWDTTQWRSKLVKSFRMGIERATSHYLDQWWFSILAQLVKCNQRGSCARSLFVFQVMPRSHIMLPPYGRRTVLRSTVCKTWFLKIVRSCWLRQLWSQMLRRPHGDHTIHEIKNVRWPQGDPEVTVRRPHGVCSYYKFAVRPP